MLTHKLLPQPPSCDLHTWTHYTQIKGDGKTWREESPLLRIEQEGKGRSAGGRDIVGF